MTARASRKCVLNHSRMISGDVSLSKTVVGAKRVLVNVLSWWTEVNEQNSQTVGLEYKRM